LFTGIVEEIGSIRRAHNTGLAVAARVVLEQLALGDSVAVNGVCLTVADLTSDGFAVDVMPETLRRTNLGKLRAGDRVNLERALLPTTRLGGHFVQGHVDGTGRLTSLRPEGGALLVRVEAAPEELRYLVEKGFIAVDGASLTVVDVTDRDFGVSLVRFTQQNSTLAMKRAGDLVNLEVDILGKYVERLVRGVAQGGITGITAEYLAEQGYT
jgi:riboflavin synthase